MQKKTFSSWQEENLSTEMGRNWAFWKKSHSVVKGKLTFLLQRSRHFFILTLPMGKGPGNLDKYAIAMGKQDLRVASST